MKIKIDITQNIIQQFQKQMSFEGQEVNPKYGGGQMKMVTFPDGLEFYYYTTPGYTVPIEMISKNPPDSEWYLIHINLGGDQQNKKIKSESITFHNHSPAGALTYCPGLSITTHFPVGHKGELASLRFPKALLLSYFEKNILDQGKSIIFEHLDFQTEQQLRKAINHQDNKLKCHGLALEVLSTLLQKMALHNPISKKVYLHGNDTNMLFKAASALRNPLTEKLPSVNELAEMAHMSPTKFKTSFRLLFGSAPKQYHHKIKMEYARDALLNGAKTPTDLSYDLGYSHPSNFTSAYKTFFNRLPSEELAIA